MAASHANENNASVSEDGEPQPPATTAARNKGGRSTIPFIIATMFWLTLGAGGWMNNLVVFLKDEFNIKSMSAAKTNSVVSGCANFFPLIGAIVADSVLGCYSVIWISSLVSLLGMTLLVLTVTVDGLRPPYCEPGSKFCPEPSAFQYAVLYSTLGLVCIGVGGTRYTLATLGANQFTKTNHQSTFFNWFFCSMYAAQFISLTCIVYIEVNLSWGLGFGICIAANALGLALFLSGTRYYNRDKPQTSPYTSLLRVVVASVRKRKTVISSESADYYYGDDVAKGATSKGPTKRFRSLNRAAMNTEGDIKSDGTIVSPWKICTVQQVEDLKSLIRILPLWSSSIFLFTPIGVQLNLAILQALTTNRHIGPRFEFPAGSLTVFSFSSCTIVVTLIDQCLWPLWKKLFGKSPTPLQRLGAGHVLNVTSMAISALVELKRRRAGHQISVAWLVPQMLVVGVGEAFHMPGQVDLYYMEFPYSMKSLSTAMVALLIGVAFYLSSGVISFVTRFTDWLPDNINDGRLDYVYWAMVVIGIANFGYFLVVSWLYKYNYVDDVKEDPSE